VFTYHSNINGEEKSFTVDLKDMDADDIDDLLDEMMDTEG
jgi:hypothetical protein